MHIITLTNNAAYYKKSNTVYSDELKTAYKIHLVASKINAISEKNDTTAILTDNGTFNVTESAATVIGLLQNQ
jgi:hypothetical protein